MKLYSFHGEKGDRWSWRLHFWRIQIQPTVIVHRASKARFAHTTTSDRWVVQCSVIYDRKRK